MSKSFCFVAAGPCERSGVRAEILCVFVDVRVKFTANDLFDELKRTLREQPTHPDGVMVIAAEPGSDQLLAYWNDDSTARGSFLGRGLRDEMPLVKSWQFSCWRRNGTLSMIDVPASGDAAFVLPAEVIIKAGLDALIERNPVVQWAPGGHAFRHPSGTVNKIFAQGRELAASEVELVYLGCALVSACPVLGDPSLEVVLIDTMGIYPIVRQGLEFAGREARVESFHSYSDLAELTVPNGAHTVVISASTSGGMAKKLIMENKFAAGNVITLVDKARSADRGMTLIALDEIGAPELTRLPDGTETQIELIGEHFTFRSKPPRGVVISRKHAPKGLATYLRNLGEDTSLALNRKRRSKGSSRLLTMDGGAFAQLPDVGIWLKEEANWRVPASIDTVIFADDNGSEELANKLARELGDVRGGVSPLPVLGANSLGQADLSLAKGVAVVQAVVGDGGLLRQISRDLRELAPKLPRYFLVGLGAAHSAEAWTRLRQFLVQGQKPSLAYGFSAWISLPVGVESQVPVWAGYAGVGSAMQTVDIETGTIGKTLIEKSIKLAVEAINSAHQSLLPSPKGKPLVLTDGFVFFPEKTRIECVSTATVFLTIASVLQQAREMEDEAMQLRATGYESVVLAPENFHRFNDSILQACILRAALPAELDYSSSPELSGLMSEFLSKVFSRHQHPYGEAGLEFAVALLSRRMRLVDRHTTALRDQAVAVLAGSGEPSALLGLVFLIDRLD